jgi:hypothetical protein
VTEASSSDGRGKACWAKLIRALWATSGEELEHDGYQDASEEMLGKSKEFLSYGLMGLGSIRVWFV